MAVGEWDGVVCTDEELTGVDDGDAEPNLRQRPHVPTAPDKASVTGPPTSHVVLATLDGWVPSLPMYVTEKLEPSNGRSAFV